MDKLLSPGIFVLALFIVTASYVHFRGRDRFGFFRQLTSFSSFLAPINAFMYLFSAVPNRPYLKVEAFPELRTLRENWMVIRDEAMALYHAGHVKASDKLDDASFNSFFRRGWKRFYLKWYGDDLPSAQQMCPNTVNLLRQVPGVKAAMFTLLPPGGELMRHRDPYAGSLRYHLGLITPNSEDCRIWVDGEPYHWRDGEDVLFDETFIHRARNDADTDRIILFCDVERPMRFRFATWFNRLFARVVVSASQTRNVEGEKVGFINKLFGGVYQLRKVGKWLKEKSIVTYYAIKYALFAGFVWAVFF